MEVRKRRASGAAGVRFAARLLGTDATGTWLIVDAGTPHVHDGGWVAYVAPNPVLCVVPDAQSWVASTSATGAKVDLSSRSTVAADHVEFVDVELDVVWRWGEPARIEDVAEFEALGLDAAVAARYRSEAERLRAAVDAGRPPFDNSFRQRLADEVGPADPLLRETWAGPVIGDLVGPVAARTGEGWLARQHAGSGWLLSGGGAGQISAVVWLGQGGAIEPVWTEASPEGAAMGGFLAGTAPSLARFPPPPQPLR